MHNIVCTNQHIVVVLSTHTYILQILCRADCTWHPFWETEQWQDCLYREAVLYKERTRDRRSTKSINSNTPSSDEGTLTNCQINSGWKHNAVLFYFSSLSVTDFLHWRQPPPPSLRLFLSSLVVAPEFLLLLFERSWKNMKNDTTFVRIGSGDLLGDLKMSKKGTSLRQTFFQFKLLTNRHRQNTFHKMKEEGQIYKIWFRFFLFLPKDFIMIFQSLVLPHFRLWKPKRSPWAKF